MARLCARDGNTANDTASPTKAPTATSITRSIADSSGLLWVIDGSSSTMIAVTGATLKLGLIAATTASAAFGNDLLALLQDRREFIGAQPRMKARRAMEEARRQ